jgi:hypothetical protein
MVDLSLTAGIEAFRPSRRAFLGGAMAVGSFWAAGPAMGAMGLAAADPALRPALLNRALAALSAHNAEIWSRDVIGVVDFAVPSAVPRFHIVDILAGTAHTILVSHGKGSDPDHSGMLQSFSNVEGSEASSEGAYLIGDPYVGVHGPSRRLLGLDPTDSNAETRAIVIHSADYVGPDVVARQGKLGRSDGCFAVSAADIGYVLAKLGQGRLLYAGR